jgi:transposase-like protein
MEQKRSRNRYSVAFKMQVVEEVENGLLSIAEAVKLYAIPGKATVWEWVALLTKLKAISTNNPMKMKKPSQLLATALTFTKCGLSYFNFSLDIGMDGNIELHSVPV